MDQPIAPQTYARIDNDTVVEIIPPWFNEEGVYVPIEQRYTPDILAALVDITGVSPQPNQWWTYDGHVFTAPSTPA